MGRTPCCSGEGLKKGAWTEEEDKKLVDYITEHGEGAWRNLPQKAGLLRCGKSCRLRWANYLRPGIKRGEFSIEEEENIIRLHSALGNKWSTIASHLPGRTDNEIKNYWNTRLKRLAVERRVNRNAPPPKSKSPKATVPERGKNNADAPDDITSKQELKNSGKFKGSVSTSSKLLNVVAAKLRASGSLASFMSQLVGGSVPSPSSAHLLNKKATNLSSSLPKSHPLSAIQAIFLMSLERDRSRDNGGVSSTTSASTNNNCNSPVESPQSENVVQLSSPRSVSTSARLLNRMATKLGLIQNRPHLALGGSNTISCNSPDQESTKTESLAPQQSPLVVDSPQEMSHFDGGLGRHHEDVVIECDLDPAFLLEIAEDGHEKERDGNDKNVVCKYDKLENFLNGNDSDEIFTSGSDSYDGCGTSPAVEAILGDLEASNNWNDCLYFDDQLFEAAIK